MTPGVAPPFLPRRRAIDRKMESDAELLVNNPREPGYLAICILLEDTVGQARKAGHFSSSYFWYRRLALSYNRENRVSLEFSWDTKVGQLVFLYSRCYHERC